MEGACEACLQKSLKLISKWVVFHKNRSGYGWTSRTTCYGSVGGLERVKVMVMRRLKWLGHIGRTDISLFFQVFVGEQASQKEEVSQWAVVE